MAIIARDTGKEYTPAPEGLHQAVCVDVVDRGLVRDQFGEKHKVQIRWQIDICNEETGKRLIVVSSYNLTLHEKGNLRKTLISWRGRDFTAQELEGFDLEKLIGANCQIQIVHNLSGNGRTYANVQAVVPIGKGMTKIRPDEDYVREKDRGHLAADEELSVEDDPVPF